MSQKMVKSLERGDIVWEEGVAGPEVIANGHYPLYPQGLFWRENIGAPHILTHLTHLINENTSATFRKYSNHFRFYNENTLCDCYKYLNSDSIVRLNITYRQQPSSSKNGQLFIPLACNVIIKQNPLYNKDKGYAGFCNSICANLSFKIDSIKYLKVKTIENQKEVWRSSGRKRCCLSSCVEKEVRNREGTLEQGGDGRAGGRWAAAELMMAIRRMCLVYHNKFVSSDMAPIQPYLEFQDFLNPCTLVPFALLLALVVLKSKKAENSKL
ncbi:hypothetical protein LXL04_000958 [Taraxacum kok-saghyz]